MRCVSDVYCIRALSRVEKDGKERGDRSDTGYLTLCPVRIIVEKRTWTKSKQCAVPLTSYAHKPASRDLNS